jgi:aspartate carbamoyltransferase regulatory subunit
MRWERIEVMKWVTGRSRLSQQDMHCTRKRALTELQADAEVKRLLRKGEQRVRKYRCDYCGEWHVGHY